MRLLITGGAGFIGQHAARHFAAQGYTVTTLDLERHDLPINHVIGDIRDGNLLHSLLKDQDAIIHLAAQVSAPASIKHPDKTYSINIEGSATLLAAAQEAKIQKVLLASSAAVYGLEPRVPTSEAEPLRPATPYAESKVAMELLASEAAVPTVCLRFFNVYGPGQKADSQYAAVIPAFLTRAVENEPLTIYGDGEQTRDFIFVEDVCRALQAALERETGSHLVVNVASGTAVTINHLARTVIHLTKSRSSIIHAPPRDGDPRASLADVTLTREKLGFEAKTRLEEGLKCTLG